MILSRNVFTRGLIVAVMFGGSAGFACADQDAGLRQSVVRLGELNGMALACGQRALAVRLREIMIETAPKQRDVGEFFENATNGTFLAFGQSGEECPDGRTLAGQIGSASDDLKKAMGAQP